MRFLFIFVLMLSLFATAFATFVLPREQLDMLLTQLPSAFRSALASTGWADKFLPGNSDTAQQRNLSTVKTDPNGVIAQATGIAIGHWLYKCDRRSVTGNSCTITHQVAEGGKVMFSWQIAVDQNGNMSARWQTATGIMIKQGIVLETSGQKPLTLPYSKCVNGYCESAAELNPKFVETLLNTDQTTATVHGTDSEPVTYTISVEGLAASLRMLGDGENKI
ncbi:MAG: hypothetical protein GY789_07790 [Hyphomicrobiales bacterium]|nr:hypothetical protein [Hyphomicrobiales bacterium]MCP4998703.1 hypothetical protein [Hyphomicrobiales bacterium]